jgi:hypothetical protein
MLRGLDNIEKASREASAIGKGDWINQVKIGDGDIAVLRFITDGDNLIRAKFHNITKMTPKGEWKVPTYCTIEDTGVCQHCSAGDVPYNTMNLWSYVYYILHKVQNPKIEAGSTAGIWPQVKHGKKVMYKEEVNAFKWFRTKYGYQGRYKLLFIKYNDKFGTLVDRDYTWSRNGSSKTDTNYDLDPQDKKPIDPEIATKAKDLPDFGNVVSGKVRLFSQAKETSQADPGASGDDSGAKIDDNIDDPAELF